MTFEPPHVARLEREAVEPVKENEPTRRRDLLQGLSEGLLLGCRGPEIGSTNAVLDPEDPVESVRALTNHNRFGLTVLNHSRCGVP